MIGAILEVIHHSIQLPQLEAVEEVVLLIVMVQLVDQEEEVVVTPPPVQEDLEL
jgi:hypothetical protein